MKQKLLCIVGPTATGKTQLALLLAKNLGGELISADSRQVYKDFDIGTGKEVAELRAGRAEKHDGYWTIDDINIYGYDIANPSQLYSAADYALFARKQINAIWQQNKLPILVGGTGLYIRAVLAGIQTAGIGADPQLRQKLEQKSVIELQQLLTTINPAVYVSMNHSDQNNPRRLIRKIEIVNTADIANGNEQLITDRLEANICTIGLTAPRHFLESRVTQRIQKMFELGLLGEAQELLNNSYSFTDPAFLAIGYSELQPYFENAATPESVQQEIVLHTNQYIKRQLTWFKADPTITWFDISNKDYLIQAEKTVQTWYD